MITQTLTQWFPHLILIIHGWTQRIMSKRHSIHLLLDSMLVNYLKYLMEPLDLALYFQFELHWLAPSRYTLLCPLPQGIFLWPSWEVFFTYTKLVCFCRSTGDFNSMTLLWKVALWKRLNKSCCPWFFSHVCSCRWSDSFALQKWSRH